MKFSKHVRQNLKDIEKEIIEHQDGFAMSDERQQRLLTALRQDGSDDEAKNVHFLAQQLQKLRQELFTVFVMKIRDMEGSQDFTYSKLPTFFKLVKNTQRTVEHEVLEWETKNFGSIDS
jgi:hypothetical protein